MSAIIHDWTQVDDGIFHAMHVNWTVDLARLLNHGALPEGYYALPEQVARDITPDVLTLHAVDSSAQPHAETQTVATAERPQTSAVLTLDAPDYSNLARRISIRHTSGDDVVALIELVSSSNKASIESLGMFVSKTCNALRMGIHVMLVDLHPPTRRDPDGIHAVIWESLGGETSDSGVRAGRLAASYESVPQTDQFPKVNAYLEPLHVGGVIPDIPLFLDGGNFVSTPLQAAYDSAFEALPGRYQEILST